jgi:hypothetical protein
MPRLARLDAPGVFHHVMIRGIERRKIFRNNKDREDFLNRLGKLLPETRTTCYGWVLIPNHAHFLFRTGKVPLATLMRRLLTGYVVIGDARAEIALNILGFIIGLYYAAIIKTRCRPASEFRPVPGSRENSETHLSLAERDHGRQTPGVLHHVMGRGIERKRIFIDKRDRQDFITRLSALAFEKLCTFCTSIP